MLILMAYNYLNDQLFFLNKQTKVIKTKPAYPQQAIHFSYSIGSWLLSEFQKVLKREMGHTEQLSYSTTLEMTVQAK